MIVNAKTQKRLVEAIHAYQQQRWPQVQAACQWVLDKIPDQVDALTLLAQTHLQLGAWKRAGFYYTKAYQSIRAAALQQQLVDTFWLGWAQVQVMLGHWEEAEFSARQALLLKESEAAYRYLGVIDQHRQQWASARAHYEQALRCGISYESWLNLGVLLLQMHEYPQAVQCLQQAIALTPDQALAWRNLSLCYQYLGEWALAEAAIDQAICLRPDDPVAISNRLFLLNYCQQYSPEYRLLQALDSGKKIQETVRRSGIAPLSHWRCPHTPQRLRVGLLGGDFCAHPVGYFLAGPLQYLGNFPVDLFIYDNCPQEDPWAERLRRSVAASGGAWHDVSQVSDRQLIQQISKEALHVLVDLSGHTAHNRLPVFTARPAPVQVTWLGYFATTGLPGMDYILVDAQVVPPGTPSWFSEQPVYLPHTYRCFTTPDMDVAVGELPADHVGAQGAQTPQSTPWVTLGCFNNFSKINQRVLHLWASILRADPNLRLFLKAPQLASAGFQETLKAQFQQLGIEAQRLLLQGPSDRQSYLEAYRQVDIALDPFPYTGGTVSIEALWMGVPLLTLGGKDMLSRSGENLLRNIGMQDWIADGESDYVARVLAFSRDRDLLRQLRRTLRQCLADSPLCDAATFADHWQQTLWRLWEQHRQARQR